MAGPDLVPQGARVAEPERATRAQRRDPAGPVPVRDGFDSGSASRTCPQPSRFNTSSVTSRVRSMSSSVWAKEMLPCLVVTGKWNTPASMSALR